MRSIQGKVKSPSLEERLSSLEERISTLENDVVMLRVDARRIESDIERTIKSLEETIGDHEYQISEAAESAETAHCICEDLRSNVTELSEKLDRIEGDVSDLILIKS